ncbi:MAG: hypothetical protein K1X29_05125 [Bdellovibrionales bacterium]|nr:hypothetical protein [Bdellovibrionales bacterium]
MGITVENNDKNLIKLIGGTSLLLSGLVALSILSIDPQKNAPSLNALARAPANIVGMALTVSNQNNLSNNFLERTSFLQFDCFPPSITLLDHQIRQVRVAGHFCKSPSQETAQQATVKNLTTGLSATIFSERTGVFSSDYIYLIEGENTLEISYLMKNGKTKNYTLKISRRDELSESVRK